MIVSIVLKTRFHRLTNLTQQMRNGQIFGAWLDSWAYPVTAGLEFLKMAGLEFPSSCVLFGFVATNCVTPLASATL